MGILECESCTLESESLQEICFYDDDGNEHKTKEDIEKNLKILSHVLCRGCAKHLKMNLIN